MEKADITFVIQLEQKLFSDAWTEKNLQDTLQFHPDENFIAEADHVSAGYLIFMQAADEGELLRIGVSKEYRRNGIGSILMEQMDYFVKTHQIDAVWLEVRESNQAARSLYEKSGFVTQGYRKNYYHKPDENAVIMKKGYENLF